MKSADSFEKFYQEKLLPELKQLETKRLRLASKYRMLIFFSVLALIILVVLNIYFVKNNFPFPGILGLIIESVVFLGTFFIILYIINKNFRFPFIDSFKQKIIRRQIMFFDESLEYNPDGMISEEKFKRSAIFMSRIDRYDGNDLVYGKIGKTAIEFSEINAEYEKQSTDSQGHSSTSYETIFKGLFFIADFNKDFRTRTVVLPDFAERYLGNAGKIFHRMNFTRDPLVKLEDPDFEKEFVVYGKDQIEARYILSPSLMKRMVDFKRKHGVNVWFSFVDSCVFVAIWVRKNLFEPRIFRTNMNYKLYSENFKYLELCIDLVEDLNLNNRIWTKE